MTTVRITQVAIRAEPSNNFVIVDVGTLPFYIDSRGRTVYRVAEYEIGLIREGIVNPNKHWQVAHRGDYIIRDVVGNLTAWTEEQYNKL